MANNDCESGSCTLTQEKIDFIKSKQSSDSVKPRGPAGLRIKIFGKSNCDNCKKAFAQLDTYIAKMENKPALVYFDLDTLDGLTEAAMYTAFDVPTIVVEKNGGEIMRWKTAPQERDFENVCGELS